MSDSTEHLKNRLTRSIHTIERTLPKFPKSMLEQVGELFEVTESLKHARDHIAGKITSGRCRYCGCSDNHPCLTKTNAPEACHWIDAGKTCCSNKLCMKRHEAA